MIMPVLVFYLWILSLIKLLCFILAFSAISLSVAAEEDGRSLPPSKEQIQFSFAPIVEKVAPGVVNIYTQTKVRDRRMAPLFDDPFFRRFFNDFGFQFNKPRTRQHNSLGSGVIVQQDGLIVTNNHVIEGADTIKVVLTDRREFSASIAAVDEKSDIAFLKINVGDETLPFLKLKDSDNLKVGDLVLAIGNPFGVGQTVTTGIVSGLARTIGGKAQYSSFIQTDAAINPGNSGGALVSIDGYLVGVNTAIFSKTGGSLGIGFAVPSNLIRALMKSLGAGTFLRPWLGLVSQMVTTDIAESLKLERPIGVLVNLVHKKSEGFRAGIRTGDLILRVNEHEIINPGDLEYRIATMGVGQNVNIYLVRDGQFKKLALTLALPPEQPLRDLTRLTGEQPLAGALIGNLSPALAIEINQNPFNEGVVIVDVARNSHGKKLGFRENDIILSINGKKMSLVEEVVEALNATPKNWKIAFNRRNRTHNLVVRN